MTRGAPASALTRLLLPALRRPTIATFISGDAGGSSGRDPSRVHSASIKCRIPEPAFVETDNVSPKPSFAASSA